MGQDVLYEFMERSAEDFRIGKSHVAVFVAVYHLWTKEGFARPFRLYCREVMAIAHISSRCTYHRIIGELRDYGYLSYQPSYYRKKASEIWIEKNESGNGRAN